MQTNTTPTISEILDRYQAECLPRLAPRTARDYVRHIRDLKRWYGDRVACELKPKDFAPFLSIPVGKKGIVQRIRQLGVLSAALTQAVSFWYVIPANVLRDVKRPRTHPRDRLVSDAEFEAVRSSAPVRVGLMMDLALRLGQRQSDLLNLKWTDIRDGYVYFQQGKTGKRLAIAITPDLKRVFGRCWMLPNRSEYVVTNKFGGQYTSEGFRACWQRTINAYCRQGGVRYSFHDLRALCATKCASLEEASKLLGHSNPGITKRVYRRGIEKVSALRVESPAARSPIPATQLVAARQTHSVEQGL